MEQIIFITHQLSENLPKGLGLASEKVTGNSFSITHPNIFDENGVKRTDCEITFRGNSFCVVDKITKELI